MSFTQLLWCINATRKIMSHLNEIRIFIFLLLSVVSTFSIQAQPSFDWTKLESKAGDLLEQNGSIGASVIIVNRDSTLFSKGFGYADLINHNEVTDSTLFVLGSITKTFTALGILKLVEEGKLKLDDEVMTLAPELPISNKWEDEFPLKVYHLLEHTSGFDELHLKDRSIPVSDDEFPLIEGISIVKNSLQIRWKPGTRFAYSNVGYLVAGYLIEKVSGKKFNDYMVQEVLEPLRMTNSSIRLKEINQELLAKSYSYSKKELPFKHIFTRPTGSLISSSQDIGQFLKILLNKGGTFLNEDGFKEFETHHSIEVFENTENGYRLGIYPRFRRDRIWLGHGGSINKYNSEFEYCYEQGLGIFVVSNGPNATKTVDGILNAFHKLIPKATKELLSSEQPNAKSNVREFEGYYVLTSPRNQLQYPFTELFTEGIFVGSDNGKITVSNLNGWKSRLVPTGRNRFSPSGIHNEYQYIIDDSKSIDVLYTTLGFSYEKTPFFLMAILGLSLMISLLVICLSQISLLIQLVNFKRKKAIHFNPQLTFELGSSIFLVGCVSYLLMGKIDDVHEPQFLTIALMLCTIIFPLFTVLGLAQTFRYKFKHLRGKIWAMVLATSMAVWSCYLIYWRFLGFAVWEY